MPWSDADNNYDDGNDEDDDDNDDVGGDMRRERVRVFAQVF